MHVKEDSIFNLIQLYTHSCIFNKQLNIDIMGLLVVNMQNKQESLEIWGHRRLKYALYHNAVPNRAIVVG